MLALTLRFWNSLLVLLLCCLLSACEESILHDLNEIEANRLLTRLQEVSVIAEKVKQADGKWSLVVAEDQSQIALRFLEQMRLVRGKVNEDRNTGTIITSREEQRFQHERALSHAIEETLLQIDSVLEARVHLNLPAFDPLFGSTNDQNKPGSAGVLVIVQADSNLSEEKISELVSGASGVPAEKIKSVVRIEKPNPVPALQVEANSAVTTAHWKLTDSQILSAVAAILSVFGLLLLYRGFSRRKVSGVW